jgi:glyoxylate/hydroxypyruvate reductase
MTVLAMSRHARTDPEVGEVHAADRLHALLPRADVVLVTVPLTPDNLGLIGATEIGLMKKGAGLVNLSRHGVVDDEALMTALRAEQLSGCVYDLEDPAHRPFDPAMWTCPNLILLPHSQTNDPGRFMDNVLDVFFENLQRRLDDRPLSNAVDPRLGY